MKTDEFSKYIFWSYDKSADLPVQIVIKQVIAYGKISDLIKLANKVPVHVIQEELTKWKEKSRFKKRINFMNKVILSK